MIRIGTCSWNYPSWQNLVYSTKKPSLAEYAKRFPTVEVDRWFWSLFGDDPVLPKRSDVESYLDQVPPDFRFTVKMPNSLSLTHYYARGGAPPRKNPHFLDPELFARTIDSLGALVERCDGLMFQFEYLNKRKMSGLEEFIERWDRFVSVIPRIAPIALEIRNAPYLSEDFFRCLAATDTVPVLMDGYHMPPVTGVFRGFSHQFGDSAIVRLHGPDRKGIEERTGKRWDAAVEPKDGLLSDVADMVAVMADRKMRVTVNINNHFEGSAPVTVAKLIELLIDRGAGDVLRNSGR